MGETLAAAVGDETPARSSTGCPSQGSHADLLGTLVPDLPAEPSGRTPVRRGDLPLGTVVHADRAAVRHELEHLLVRAGLAVEIARLRVEVRWQLAEVERSRARIVSAAIDERRRLERDLHDGAQQQLVAIGLDLRHLQAGLDPGSPVRDQLDESVGRLGDADPRAARARPRRPARPRSTPGSVPRWPSWPAARSVRTVLDVDRRAVRRRGRGGGVLRGQRGPRQRAQARDSGVHRGARRPRRRSPRGHRGRRRTRRRRRRCPAAAWPAWPTGSRRWAARLQVEDGPRRRHPDPGGAAVRVVVVGGPGAAARGPGAPVPRRRPRGGRPRAGTSTTPWPARRGRTGPTSWSPTSGCRRRTPRRASELARWVRERHPAVGVLVLSQHVHGGVVDLVARPTPGASATC